MHIYTFCQHVIEPGTPYYITVSAGTTGGIGKEEDNIFFTKEQGSYISYVYLFVYLYIYKICATYVCVTIRMYIYRNSGNSVLFKIIFS